MFLCCGDALYDLFIVEDDHTLQSQASLSHVTLAGDIGGSPLNVAGGLARLGQTSRYLTKLSTDLYGQRMREFFTRNNIDSSLCIDTSLNSTLAMVEKQPDGSARYVFYTNNTADVSLQQSELPATLPGDIRVVHVGSYSTAVNPTSDTLIALTGRETASRVISYDPNLRPSIEPDVDHWRQVFNAHAKSANLIKASDEDIETLLGKGREDQFVADCFNHGAQLVFITRGPDGASGFKPDGTHIKAEGVKVDVQDTVGAGDTFQAATLHWLQAEGHLTDSNQIEGEVDISASMAFAIKAAAVTCTRKGADLPTLADLA
jgi:fructokinase